MRAEQEVHLLIIFFLLLGTICVYYFWKSKVGAPVPGRGRGCVNHVVRACMCVCAGSMCM